MLKTFSIGGVHPPENKLSSKSGIKELPLPKTVIIPFGQHLGAPSKPVVNKGDEVKVGQVIAESNGFVSAHVHSSVSGKVVKIDKALDASGYKRDAIFINVEGDDWLDTIDKTDTLIEEIKISQKEITDKIAQAGIVGLGGATFPSHIKAMVPKGKKG